ncbi:hypothetical protein [Mycoplasma bradburyae]|uniref:hypothetical protein n=1 Tax=Mycoplasma bradburyae TaxID=2963128 RepID=UPI00233F9124|nr:hypothetical protein [Mycoplasma bradburyae]
MNSHFLILENIGMLRGIAILAAVLVVSYSFGSRHFIIDNNGNEYSNREFYL